MPPAALAAFQIFSFMASHKDELKQAVVDVENIAAEAAGPTKGAVIKSVIAGALGIEAQIEAAWPFVAPIFNAFVAKAKGAPAQAPTA